MNRYLIFQLQGAMASWGEIAVGDVRHTRALPGRSALLGLLAAALGIRRDDDAALNALNAHYQFIVCAGKLSAWARDYHTVQVPREARKVRYVTRKDELRDAQCSKRRFPDAITTPTATGWSRSRRRPARLIRLRPYRRRCARRSFRFTLAAKATRSGCRSGRNCAKARPP